MTHTHCLNCNCSLSNNHAIEEHLKYSHGLQIRMSVDPHHPAYCHCCHKYVGGTPSSAKGDQCLTESRRALEKHLTEQHNVYMCEGSLSS